MEKQNEGSDTTSSSNQSNSTTENSNNEIKEFKELLNNDSFNIFDINLKYYTSNTTENCFSVFEYDSKVSINKSVPPRASSANPSSSTNNLPQISYIKRYDTQNTIVKNKQFFLSHYYSKIPATFNKELLSDQINVYMTNKNFCLAKLKGFSLFDTKNNFFPIILTERPANGSLLKFYEKNKTVTEEQKLAFISGITYGIFYIHSNGFIHSNLSAATVYFNKNNFPVICDYVFIPNFTVEANDMDDEGNIVYKYQYELREEIEKCQNRLYTAPEILNGDAFDSKSDIYSLGLIIYFILCEKEATFDEKGCLNFPPDMSEEWKTLINKCINENASERITAKEILDKLFETKRTFSEKIDPYVRIIEKGYSSNDDYDEIRLCNQVIPNFNDIDYDTQLIALAAQKGNIEYIEKLGNLFLNGLGGLKKDEQSAFICFEKASHLNSLESTLKLAEFYSKGIGCDPSVVDSCRAYNRAYEIMDDKDPEIELKRRTLTLKVKPNKTIKDMEKEINSKSKKTKITFTVSQESLTEDGTYKQMTLTFKNFSDLFKASHELKKRKEDYVFIPVGYITNESNVFDSLTETLQRIKLEDYEPILENEQSKTPKYVILGEGVSSKVYLVKDKDGNLFAAKVFTIPIKKAFDETNNKYPINLFKREIVTVSGFNHPAIIKYIGFNEYSLIEKGSKDNTIKPTIIMEYKKNDNLEKAILSKIFEKDPTSKLKIIIGIASGIRALNRNNIVHRDLKTANILLDENNEPVICDFGCSRQFSDIVENNMSNYIGTPVYRAPELIVENNNQIYTYHVDIYSFGIILYQVLTDTPELDVYNCGQNLFKINKKKLDNILPDNVDTLHPFFADLIRACWTVRFNDRPDPEIVYFEIINAVAIHGEYLLPGANMTKVNEYIEKLSKYD